VETPITLAWLQVFVISGVPETTNGDPLDKLITIDEAKSARLIKIDVEGAEDSVIRGMIDLFPVLRSDCEIVLELNPELNDTGFIMRTLRNHGWHPFSILPGDRMDNYFTRKSYSVERLTGSIDGRVDVLFSQTATPQNQGIF
jgi:hypothetical protein